MELNSRQREAVEYGKGPLLIVAGAGSGKTKTVTARIARLMERGIPGDRILAITFTNKAAREMGDRVEKLMIERVGGFKSPFLGTFHALGASILRREAKLVGRTGNFTIFDQDDAASTLRRALRDIGIPSDRLKPAAAASKIGTVKSRLLDAREYLDEREHAAFERYEALLGESNAFDFDDLLEKVVRIFRSSPETLAKYQGRWDHVLVDEYQDVNAAQYTIVRALSEKHRNIAVVGDDAQSIYGWRHADIENFLRFEEDWPDAKVVKLEQSYRSTGTIITAASALIAANVRQKPKELWTENPAGAVIEVVRAENPDLEADFIGEEMLKVSTDASRAVLYRTNAQSRAIEQALIARDIPYQVFGGVKFYERKEVRDVIAALRLALNPKDAASAERLMKALPKALAREAIAWLPVYANGKSPAEIIGAFVERTAYEERLAREFTNTEERMENVRELVSFAADFQDLASFVERVSLLDAGDAGVHRETEGGVRNGGKPTPRASQPPVSLMTIHLAKGLEFDHVFLAGATEGLLPHERSYRTSESLEEERRLMYVAMTRARRNLTVSFSYIPSRFLYEIPQDLLEFTDLNGDADELPDENSVYIT
jgi:DNA helicase-2/ATP-dependent DNA helicase PcrA